jgi:hypothetical protein
VADSNQHQATQAGLAALAAQDLAGVYPHISGPDDPRLSLLIQAITTKYGRLSGALSGRFYQRARVDAGLGKHSAAVADPAPLEQVTKTVGWATHDNKGQPLSLVDVHPRLEGATTKLVLDVGRDTIVNSVAADAKAKGWARVPEPGCCAFCALLATRGAVYKSEDSADFKSHDHCRCHAEPVFTAYEPSAQIRQWQADYAKATHGVRGSRNQRIAWRQAFEGRTTN